MDIKKYLVIGAPAKRGAKPTAKITHGLPRLQPNEISLELTLTIPDSLFKKPSLCAHVIIDEKIAPESISADVVNHIQSIVSERIPFKVEVTAINN